MSLSPLRNIDIPSSKPVISVARRSRKLLVSRLREIDTLSAKEVALIVANADKIKDAFRARH